MTQLPEHAPNPDVMIAELQEQNNTLTPEQLARLRERLGMLASYMGFSEIALETPETLEIPEAPEVSEDQLTEDTVEQEYPPIDPEAEISIAELSRRLSLSSNQVRSKILLMDKLGHGTIDTYTRYANGRRKIATMTLADAARVARAVTGSTDIPAAKPKQ